VSFDVLRGTLNIPSFCDWSEDRNLNLHTNDLEDLSFTTTVLFAHLL
jgi:hypothetical protein